MSGLCKNCVKMVVKLIFKVDSICMQFKAGVGSERHT